MVSDAVAVVMSLMQIFRGLLQENAISELAVAQTAV